MNKMSSISFCRDIHSYKNQLLVICQRNHETIICKSADESADSLIMNKTHFNSWIEYV